MGKQRRQGDKGKTNGRSKAKRKKEVKGQILGSTTKPLASQVVHEVKRKQPHRSTGAAERELVAELLGGGWGGKSSAKAKRHTKPVLQEGVGDWEVQKQLARQRQRQRGEPLDDFAPASFHAPSAAFGCSSSSNPGTGSTPALATGGVGGASPHALQEGAPAPQAGRLATELMNALEESHIDRVAAQRKEAIEAYEARFKLERSGSSNPFKALAQHEEEMEKAEQANATGASNFFTPSTLLLDRSKIDPVFSSGARRKVPAQGKPGQKPANPMKPSASADSDTFAAPSFTFK